MSRLFTSLIVSLAAANTLAVQADTSRPKLVVGIMVDQLRTDYVDYLREMFTEKGFRRLIDNGVYLKDVDFKIPVKDAAAATAMVYTGAYPSINGISSAKTFSPATGKSQSSMSDEALMGNYTSEGYSPKSIRVSTLADELQVDGAGLGQIFSVAPDAEVALAMTGHAGTSAFWLDDNSGKWSSTTYFKESPRTISKRNLSSPLEARIDTMIWKPLNALDKYPGLPAQKKFWPFKYQFPKSARDVFSRFKDSPLVNQEVTDIAIGYLDEYQLGHRGDVIDMLNVAYTAEPWPYVSDGDPRLELEDSYLRLDRQIGRLLDAIDKGAGLENTVIFLTSTGYYEDPSAYDSKYRVPSGDFSYKRATSLLNAYLSAKYGNGQYIITLNDGKLYLDHKTIEDKKLDEVELARSARDFLSRMSGVAEARTFREILASASAETEALRLSIDPKNAADVYLSFTPGWNVINDLVFPAYSSPVRDMMVNTPAIIMAPSLKAQEITDRVDATGLAPTIAGLIRIRAPNGASTRPLLLETKK